MFCYTRKYPKLFIHSKYRIELQDHVRRLEKDPREEDKKEIDKKRSLLLSEFESLGRAHRRAVTIPVPAAAPMHEYDEVPHDFDNLDDEETINVAQQPASDVEDTTVFPEHRPIPMPSTCLPKDHPYSKIELRLRKDQAHRYIMALREVIAEKSFQYTHVIRVAPRKAVATRARQVVLKLNKNISFYSRIYSRCRAAIERLSDSSEPLQVYKILTRQDVKASSAIKNPNTPGSTSLSLSWIWQITTAGDNTPASLLECKYEYMKLFLLSFTLLPVQRIHWLRARAQYHRWEEEKLLVHYEMSWTVRYFLHEGRKWKERSTNLNISPGAKAYAARQTATWVGRAASANKYFKLANPDHVIFNG
jgi:hypothetical protein